LFRCAEKYRLPLLTLDKRLVRAAKNKGISVLEVAE
jgi:predicted nucleic acid-binding protein